MQIVYRNIMGRDSLLSSRNDSLCFCNFGQALRDYYYLCDFLRIREAPDHFVGFLGTASSPINHGGASAHRLYSSCYNVNGKVQLHLPPLIQAAIPIERLLDMRPAFRTIFLRYCPVTFLLCGMPKLHRTDGLTLMRKGSWSGVVSPPARSAICRSVSTGRKKKFEQEQALGRLGDGCGFSLLSVVRGIELFSGPNSTKPPYGRSYENVGRQ
ncbi:hypothetical protein BX600DRAFT_221875 [Xylariales sp. PMI_506]|nr:hypothetical protein BX600DRAFT_221875 [Xylariales sp. PMI_506]